MELVNSIRSEFVMIMLVSSAKSTGFAEVAMVFGRSFIYSIKKQRTKDGALGNAIPNGFPFREILLRFIGYNYSLISVFQIRLN